MTEDRPLTRDDLLRLYELEKIVNVSGNYTVTDQDDVILVAAASPVNIQLPLAKGGRRVTITRVSGAASVTVLPASGETVNGGASNVISTSYAPLRLKAIKGIGHLVT